MRGTASGFGAAGLGLATLVTLPACGAVVSIDSEGSGGATVCTFGDTRMCAGPEACQGDQACAADGSSWGACDCGTSTSSGGSTCDAAMKCTIASDCPAADTVCKTMSCTEGCCVSSNADSGIACGDNGGVVCDGSGSCVWKSDCLTPPPGIVSWWTGDGTTADVGGINNGTADGNLSYAPGMVGQAFLFDGESYVGASSDFLPVGSADRTVEFWANLTTSFGSATNSEMFVEYGSMSSGEDFAIFTSQTSTVLFSQWGEGVQGGSFGQGALGTWSHVAVTSSSGTITIFVDGKQVVVQSISPYNTAAGTKFVIGGVGIAADGTTHRVHGMVDEVTVYDRALSASEVAAIHGAGSAGKCH